MRVSQSQTRSTTWGRSTTTWGRSTTWGRQPYTTWGRTA
jgi:hypothetical protein